MTYEEKRNLSKIKAMKRKEEETKAMIDSLGVKIRKVLPSVIYAGVTIEKDEKYISIYVEKHPTGLITYRVIRREMIYPFNIISEKEYLRPIRKYAEIISELKEIL